jgi:RNA polymerase sigma factor (sigma-70 family)
MNQAQTIALYQPLLHTIAYNIVRCKADAEDIVQETFLKWLSVDHQKIENTKAYLITAVKNNCLRHIETVKKKKEEYLEALQSSDLVHWFKEINLSQIDLDINLKAAFRVMQTKLQPIERAVFLLKDVFDVDYETLQKTLDKNKAHCRQLLCRARKKLAEETSRIHLDLPNKSSLLESFRQACDLESASDLIGELKKDITEAIRKKF